jgi:methionyl-tRNA formyltransferase
LIRSLSEKPGAWCILNGSRVKILNSKYVKLEGKTGHNIVSSANKSSLIIACREGAVEIITLQKEGKKPVSAKEFLSGYKENNIYFN